MNILTRIDELEKKARRNRIIPGENVHVSESLLGTVINADIPEDEDYKWRMSIVQNDDGEPELKIEGYGNGPITLENITSDGTYDVKAAVNIRYPHDPGAVLSTSVHHVFFGSGKISVCGVRTVKIGSIKRDTAGDDVVFTVEEQDIIGDFPIYAQERHDFLVSLYFNSGEDGDIHESFQPSMFKCHVNAGFVLIGTDGSQGIPESCNTFDLESGKSYVHVDSDGEVSLDNSNRSTLSEDVKVFLIAVISHTNGSSWNISQLVSGDIICPIEDDFTVKVDEDDTPGFLEDKVTSENETLDITTVEDEEDGYKLNLEVNFDKFTSGDGSISIFHTQAGGIDLAISSDFIPSFTGDDYISVLKTGNSVYISAYIDEIARTVLTKVYAGDGITISTVDNGISINATQSGEGVTIKAGTNVSISKSGNEYTINCTAQKGDTGEKGDKGDTGEKGDKGDKGDDGAATISSPAGTLSVASVSSAYTMDVNWGCVSSSDNSISCTVSSGRLDVKSNLTFSGDSYVSLTKSGNAVTASADVNAILSQLTVEGDSDVSLTKTGNKITAAFTGAKIPTGTNGIVVVKNGQIQVVPIGNGVMVGANGEITWVSTATCQGG